MSEDTEMTFENFEETLKSLKFRSILQWMSANNWSPLVLLSKFEEIKESHSKELLRGGGTNSAKLHLYTNDENLVGQTPFHFALEARKVDETLFEDMMNYVADGKQKEKFSENIPRFTAPWELKDSAGKTVFQKAVMIDDVGAVVKMISLGAQPEKMIVLLPDNSGSLTNILGFSIAYFSNRVFRYLLQNFICCNTWDICGRRPVHIAVIFGNEEVFQTLIERDQLEFSSKLFNCNSNIDEFRTRENFSIECYSNDFSASNDDDDDGGSENESDSGLEVESIISNSISAPEVENQNGSNESIHFLSQTTPSDYEDAGLFMFDNLTIPERVRGDEDGDLIPDDDGEGEDTEFQKFPSFLEELDSNLYHVAVDHNRYKIIQLLLKSIYGRYQVHQKRADGMTPLHIAAKRNNQEIIKLLVEEGGAKIEVENDLNGATPLHVACENGAVEATHFFLRHGSNPNSEDEEGLTPLHYACKNKKGTQCIQLLIEFGAKTSPLSWQGETPIYKAISRWNVDGFWKLLEYGGDPSIPHCDGTVVLGFLAANSLKELVRFIEFCQGSSFKEKMDLDAVVAEEGKTSLHIAVKALSVDAVKVLVSAGASVLKCDENGISPLADAIKMQNCSPIVHEEIMLALLSRKPEINSHGVLSLYPLHFSSQKRFYKLMKRLLDMGIDSTLQKDSMTSLHLAAKEYDVTGMKILLAGGADWNIIDEEGYSPLLLCAREHFLEGVEILVKFGASLSDTNSKNENGIHLSSLRRSPNIVSTLTYFAMEKGLTDMISSDGEKPIHMHVRNGRIEGIRYLLRLGCEINELSGKDETPLMIACETGNIPAVRILLRCGANVNICNRSGHNAMYFFSRSEKVSLCILRLLLTSQGYLNHKDEDGDTLLHEAAIGNQALITRLLVKRGIDVNIRNNEGETALFIASKAGFTNIVRTLLSKRPSENSADPTLLNNNAESPYQAARSEGHTEIVSILLKVMNISLSTFAPKSLFMSSKESEEDLTESFRKLHASEICIVCQEEFKNGDLIRKFPCLHEFHNDCILPWIGGEEMGKNINCPICKQSLVPDGI